MHAAVHMEFVALGMSTEIVVVIEDQHASAAWRVRVEKMRC